MSTLLVGIGVLLVGNGLLGTLLGLRASREGFPDSLTGLVMSAYFLGFILGTFVVPKMILAVGHIRAFAALAALAAATAIGHELLVHPLAWALLRVATGVSLVGLYVVVESWLNHQTPAPYRGQVFAVYVTVTLVALAAGQWLLVVDPAFGMRAFAVASALFSLGLVPIALTSLPEPRPVATARLPLGRLYAASPLGLAAGVASGLLNGTFWGMGAVFAARVGLAEADIATFMSATILGGVLLQWPIGRLSDRIDRRKVLIAVALVAALIATVAWIATRLDPPVLIAAFFLYGGLAFSVYGLSVAHVNDHLDLDEVLEGTRGILLVHGLGATVGPALAGGLMAWLGASGLPLFLAATCALLAGFGIARVFVRPPVPAREQGAFVPLARTSQAILEMLPEAQEAEPAAGDEGSAER